MLVAEAESVISRADDQGVWRWQAEPYRLWSLFDMIRFHNGAFTAAWGQFNRAWMDLLSGRHGGDEDEFWKSIRELREQIELDQLPLSEHVKHQFKDLEKEKDVYTGSQRPTVLTIMARTLMNAIVLDLSSQVFLSIPPSRRELFLQHNPPFGPHVSKKFDDANADISSAARCFALDEWAACVFHCMRVLECGLRPMANRFSVSFEKGTWHAVLVGIEKGLNDLRSKGNRTTQEDEDITNYSDAAVQFRHFKDAWRNHVTHGRGEYDEPKAIVVFNSVNSFMRKMAEIIA